MNPETSRKRPPSNSFPCDPALLRLKKAARAIALAQKLANHTETPPCDPSQQVKDTGSVSNVTVTIMDAEGPSKLGTKQERATQLASVISSSTLSSSDSLQSNVQVGTLDAVVTPPKRKTMFQQVPRGSAPAPPMESSRLRDTSPTQQVCRSDQHHQQRFHHDGRTKRASSTSSPYDTVSCSSSEQKSRACESLCSTKHKVPSTAAGSTLTLAQSQQPTKDRCEGIEKRDESTHGSFTPSHFDRVIRFAQFCVPFIAFWMMARSNTAFSARDVFNTQASGLQNNSSLTLRDILKDHETGFHLAMAPAFFGFYGYFGALAAWYEVEPDLPIQSLAGASAGAMAAVLIGAGVSPQTAADFCSEMTVSRFADFPGFGAIFRGHKFERIMDEFLQSTTNRTTVGSWKLEDAITPVAVTAFDLQSLQGKILTTGSMAKAARASATFPLLFQPVGWVDDSSLLDYVFIDGGIADPNGLVGLTKTLASSSSRRIVNLSIGSLLPARKPFDVSTTELITVSIYGLPQPSPLAMAKGPMAYEKARKAMLEALDTPLKRRGNGFELSIRANR